MTLLDHSANRCKHASDNPGIEQSVVGQLRTFAGWLERRCIGRKITNDLGPASILINQVAKNAPSRN